MATTSILEHWFLQQLELYTRHCSPGNRGRPPGRRTLVHVIELTNEFFQFVITEVSRAPVTLIASDRCCEASRGVKQHEALKVTQLRARKQPGLPSQ
ncbi:hypothetical protein F2P81_012204 [Scophthalmus maximus]|uniref:Uncharacterized protein n=1 Tax=Scophthalmus maximus TaxID=52904 RepID=A0A6A4SH14_SCOMX|nr:hypothetical protein F2P81_012204 [Scophthalmus maximus]